MDPHTGGNPQELPAPYSLRWRAGVGIPDGGDPRHYRWPDPAPGWYLNWHFGVLRDSVPDADASSPPSARPTAVVPPADQTQHPEYLDASFQVPDDASIGMEYVPMVYDLDVPTATLESVVQSLPGRVWLVGNEPDVRWQGNLTPEAYAAGYHRVYRIIKRIDPTAQVAIGGISQVTPLRLAYLDRVLEHYAATYGHSMPVDVWNFHAFILQEKRDDWGVDIPPGFESVNEGRLYTVEGHGDLNLLREQIVTMRAWMQARGQQDKPLWLTEYGILMPAAYGFPPEVVAAYMQDSFDLFRELRDPDLGWAEDEDRLLQRWIWFSAGYDRYPTGDLFDAQGNPTLLMQTYRDYLSTAQEP